MTREEANKTIERRRWRPVYVSPVEPALTWSAIPAFGLGVLMGTGLIETTLVVVGGVALGSGAVGFLLTTWRNLRLSKEVSELLELRSNA